jgi:hypothetical protein
MRKLTRENSTPELRLQQRALVKTAAKAWINTLPEGKHYSTTELSAKLSASNYFAVLTPLSALVDEMRAEGYCEKGKDRFKTAKGFWAYPNVWKRCEPNGPKLAPTPTDPNIFSELAEEDYPDLPVSLDFSARAFLRPALQASPKKKSVEEIIAERKAKRE